MSDLNLRSAFIFGVRVDLLTFPTECALNLASVVEAFTRFCHTLAYSYLSPGDFFVFLSSLRTFLDTSITIFVASSSNYSC